VKSSFHSILLVNSEIIGTLKERVALGAREQEGGSKDQGGRRPSSKKDKNLNLKKKLFRELRCSF